MEAPKHDMTTQQITGSEALAYGALEAGVQLVTGYPGSPGTATLEALLLADLPGDRVRVEWAINEKSAFDTAFGASLAGVRSLLCLKSVGLNVALDSLMVGNLAPGDGGFVVLVGDDPGGWSSQNEEDSRPLAAAAEVPLLEPTTAAEARAVMRQAFDLSEQFRVPVVLRITQALAQDRAALAPPLAPLPSPRPAHFERQPDRFNVLPIHVVEFHRCLQATLAQIQARFECDPSNVEETLPRRAVVSQSLETGETHRTRTGQQGVIAAGYAYQKLTRVLAASPAPVRILRLTTLHPLPRDRIAAFLRQVDAALVVEETAPYVETQVRAIAQHAALTLPIYGRSSGHLPGAGELLAGHIATGLTALLRVPESTPLRQPAQCALAYPSGQAGTGAGARDAAEWQWPSLEPIVRPMPSRQPLCDDCPYIPAFQALLAVMERHGGRDAFIVTGETGCMVRGQLPPWQIMDLKYAMGSSIGLAAGLARAGLPQKIVALSGDSALLHSGLGELIDAAQAGVALLVVVLANETTALSGGQPHPATGHDAQGRPRRPVDLVALIQAAAADSIRVVDPVDTVATEAAFEEGLASGRLAVVVVQRPCPVWERVID